jgi:penicillin-binding protein 1A
MSTAPPNPPGAGAARPAGPGRGLKIDYKNPEWRAGIWKWAKPVLMGLGSVAAVGFATVGLLWNTLFAQMPQLPSRDSLWTLNRDAAVEFIDTNGATISVRGPRYGRFIKLEDFPEHVVNAFLAAEDKRYFTHAGVDLTSIMRATVSNLQAGRTVSGASTITQQLVKNLFLTPDQTIRRKAQEARLAWDLEHLLSKREVLELYLNRVYLGAGAYGVDAAAHVYFGVDARNLTVAQAAMLAGFPKAPSRFAAAAQNEAARQRQAYVLEQMVEAGWATSEAAAAARTEDLHFAAEQPDVFQGHALDYAMEQVRILLPNAPPDLVVKLTLDVRMQEGAQKAVTDGITQLGPEKHASQGAAILMDRSGAIRAMVGGLDYGRSKFNRAVQARRQPGSSFKMFVYAAALQAGMRPNTVRYDEPITIGTWQPRNYGGSYRGAVTLSEALAESLNTVSAQIGVEIGVDRVTTLARNFGIRTQLHNYPSVTLGSDEVTLIDITTGYGVLARGGVKMTPYIIQEIRNSRGDLLYQATEAPAERVYDEGLSQDMTGMLSRVVVQGTGRAARLPNWDVAGKTGTSQAWRDAWFIGYTARFVGGVWVGNDDDRPMARITGGELSARIWQQMMVPAHEGLTPEPLQGAKQPEEFLNDEDQYALAYYRRLSNAFAQVASRSGG